ncbi:unnamed protein product [Parnassius mnemosyne]|uniref:Uncharacterized protein n=1 Tax=Parnassius mnemosyne TaxID=213953 RepID=A0AAV1LH13_9NEOP
MRRCRRERAVREVLQCFKQAFLRPRRTLIMSVAAAYNSRSEESSDCDVGITDDEMEGLLTELDTAKNLLKSTIQCKRCGKRLVIDKKQATVQYCEYVSSSFSLACKNPLLDMHFNGCRQVLSYSLRLVSC